MSGEEGMHMLEYIRWTCMLYHI